MAMIRDGAGEVITPNNPLAVRAEASGIAQPVDIQARYAELIQTHNAVSVPLSGNSLSSWFACEKFDKVAVTLSSGGTTRSVNIDWSNDGTTVHGSEVIVASGTTTVGQGISDTKAPYFRLNVLNGHTANVTMSAWAFLKA